MNPNLTIPLKIKGLENREFEGLGSVFGNEDLGGDVVLPGAFKRTLADHKKTDKLPPMFWGHDSSKVPGKWLAMSEGHDGLKVRGTLAPTPLGDEIRTLLKMDAVSGLSIGYRVSDWDYDKEGRRLLKEVDLWEVSIVSLPMNPLATIENVKSRTSGRGEYVPTKTEFEQTLREAGCSRSVAKHIVRLVNEERLRKADEPDGACANAGAEEIDFENALTELQQTIYLSSIKGL